MLKTLDQIGFQEPTSIQKMAIPVVKSGQDVLGIAQTGTGKTAAYLIPLFNKLVKAEGMDPRAIVLVPTRELSIQVGEDVLELSANSNIRSVSVYGGIGWTKHAELVRPGIDILVATPGRLIDLYKFGALSLKHVKTLVIDEADRMLDMGFMSQLRQLLEIIPPRRQNLLFSATFSDSVQEMADEFLAFPKRVEVAPSATPAEKVTQGYYQVENYRTRLNLIADILKDTEVYNRVIVFCTTKDDAEGVYKVLERKVDGDIRVIHSNKGQSSRINSIDAFKAGDVRILVTTDLSARGIDVSSVSHVFNFTLPSKYEDYVHRIGRTARANKEGAAISFVSESQIYHLRKIEEMMSVELEKHEIPEGVEIVPESRRERQLQMLELDKQKKMIDPAFKGGFHEKKKREPRKHPMAFNPKSTKLRKNRKQGAGKKY